MRTAVPFSVQLLYSVLRAYRLWNFVIPASLSASFAAALIQDQLAFMLPLERGLVFGISQFQHHRPEPLVGGEVFYQQRHIPKAAFHSFQGSGGFVIRADLVQPAFQALVASIWCSVMKFKALAACFKL